MYYYCSLPGNSRRSLKPISIGTKPVKMKNSLIVCSILICATNVLAQQKNKVFLTGGYGLAGSFFVRSYEDFNPMPGSKVFYKKNFVGVSQDVGMGINLSKNWEVRVGLNYQHFTRAIYSLDTLGSTEVKFQKDIHHRNYIWYGIASKKLEFQRSLLSFGLGLYYIIPKQEEIDITPAYVNDIERDQKNYNLNDGGSFIEVGYEYKFQPKVNLGIKGQFYYTLSAGIAESITLFPFVKILF